MRIIIFLTVILSCITIRVNAQESISINIKEVTKNDKIHIAVSIANNGEGDISLYNHARYGYNAGIYEMKPSSYMTFIGNSLTDANKESRPVVLSGTIGSMGECTRKFVIVRKGETLTDEVLLFGPIPSPYVAFSTSDSAFINQVKVQFTLNYYDTAEQKNKKAIIASNILVLSR